MEDDWRVMGQERYLGGVAFVRKPYKRWSVDWDHDHCEFCHRKLVEVSDHPQGDESATVGYAAVGTGPEGQNGYHWVCDDCFADFRHRFGWTVLEA